MICPKCKSTLTKETSAKDWYFCNGCGKPFSRPEVRRVEEQQRRQQLAQERLRNR